MAALQLTLYMAMLRCALVPFVNMALTTNSSRLLSPYHTFQEARQKCFSFGLYIIASGDVELVLEIK